ERGVEGRADPRERGADRGDRAAGGGPGARVSEAAHSRPRRGAHLCRAAARGGAARRRPTAHGGHRARGRGDPGREVRSRGGGQVMPLRIADCRLRNPSVSVVAYELARQIRNPQSALRMLMNNLDPEVAERPQDLVVYGGTGKAARDWPSFDAICRTLVTLGDDETLLVQSGRPVGVFTTHAEAPRVLIANANLVGRW